MTNELFPFNLNFYQSANIDGKYIAENFVIRKVEFGVVMDDIRRNPMEGSIQHFLFLGRRGSGKSTLLKRIEYEIEADAVLSQQLIPINLAEEQANIYRLFDLWEEIINELNNRDISVDYSHLDASEVYEYTRQLYTLIQEALAKSGKKIVLLLDNIDRIFANISDEASLLREVLLNHKDLKIIGGSTRMSEHFWQYDLPFYNFFRIIRLEALSRADVHTLLLHWSEAYQLPTLKDFIKNKPGQLETIRILTDGLPRTLKFFISIIVNRTQKDSYNYLKQIMEYVTPLYQERLNNLPAAHRKIVLQLAFIWEATEVKALAEACKIESKLVSAHLKQLYDNNIVAKIPTSKKNHLYRIDERFFNLWLIFTQGSPNDKRRQKCLTIFLENWYDAPEIKKMTLEHLQALEGKCTDANDVALFSKALVHSKYITVYERDEIIEKTLQLDGLDEKLKIELPEPILDKISELIEKKDWDKAIKLAESIEQEDGIREGFLGIFYGRKRDEIKAEKYYLQAINKGDIIALNNLANLYKNQEKVDLAENYYLQAIEKKEINALYNLALLYDNQGKFDLAETYYLQAIDKGHMKSLINLAILYDIQEKFDLAETYYLQAINKGYKMAVASVNLAFLYYKINSNKEKALQLIQESIEKDSAPNRLMIKYLVYVWNGIFTGIKEKTLQLLESDNKTQEFLLTTLLIHLQKNIVLSVFEDEKIREKFEPLYYATLLLENGDKDESIALKIPPEILVTVQSIVEFIKEKQVFYYGK